MVKKLFTIAMTLAFVFAIGAGIANDVLAAPSLTVKTTSKNTWGPLNGTASDTFYTRNPGNYVVSGLPEGASVSLYWTPYVMESYPGQVHRNFVMKIQNGSVVALEKKMYFFQDPEAFRGQNANILFTLMGE